MNKKHFIAIVLLVALTFILYRYTSIVPPKSVREKMISDRKMPNKTVLISFDSILADIYPKMKPVSVKFVKSLYDSLKLQNSDKLSINKRLSKLWFDANQFEPYIQAESAIAQLENSEKTLTFVGHSILERLLLVPNAKYNSWLASECRTLFVKALAINPNADSTKIGLGATYMFDPGAEGPMTGILEVKKVADRDSNNIFANYILGVGNTINGMSDKGIERFKKVLAVDPTHINALLRLANLYELKGDIENAIITYKKLIPLATNKEQLEELNNKISSLKK